MHIIQKTVNSDVVEKARMLFVPQSDTRVLVTDVIYYTDGVTSRRPRSIPVVEARALYSMSISKNGYSKFDGTHECPIDGDQQCSTS